MPSVAQRAKDGLHRLPPGFEWHAPCKGTVSYSVFFVAANSADFRRRRMPSEARRA